MSESVACQNSYCKGVFTISEPPDPQAVCSVCGLTWDEAASAEDLANDEVSELHVATDTGTEIKDWADVQVVTPPLDKPDERPKLLAWYKQFDELKSQSGGPRKEKAWFGKVLALAKNDPELNNPDLRVQSVTFVGWFERYVIEANDRAWPRHDDYDEGEDLSVLAERTRQDHHLWDAFQAAIQHLEPPSPEFERFLRLPITWLRDGRHDIEEDALDVETKALRADFDALYSNPDTHGFFIMGPADFRKLPISAPLLRWAIDMCAGRIPRPRGYPPIKAHRHARIIRAIERFCELGLKATRNDASPADSACDVVAAAIHLDYEAVKKIWKKRRSKPSSRRSSSR